MIITVFNGISATAREDLNNSGHFFRSFLAVAQMALKIAVIAVAPTGKAPFVYSYVQMRLKGQYNGK